MKPLLLTFDVEEFDLPLELGRKLALETQVRASARGLRRILPHLERRRVRATFFVTAVFARARPAIVADLAARGHEVGVHGLAHGDDYAALAADDAVARLDEARRCIEQTAGAPAPSVRTPRLRPCPPSVLRRAGFLYDASPHPTWVPGRYNNLSQPRKPWREDGMLRLPISVLPAVRLPVSWLWYRLAGAAVGGAAARAASFGAPYLHLYFHPWEALRLRPFGVPPILAARSGEGFIDILKRLLARSERGFEAMTIGEFARAWESAAPAA